MKIGIDARMYGAESTTGIGVYIQKLTDVLFEIDQKNEYILFMNEPAFSKFNPPNSRITKVKVNCPWYSYKEQYVMPRFFKKYKVDLMHFPHFNVPVFYRGKFVVSIHDITPKFFPGPKVKKSLIRKFGYNLVFNSALKNSEKIITISQHTKNNIIKYFDVNAEKINVIYPGVNVLSFPAVKSSCHSHESGNPDLNHWILDTSHCVSRFRNDTLMEQYNIKKPFLFYVGVWRDHKNLPTLIKAFDEIKNRGLDYQLVLGGKSDNRYPEIKVAIDNSRYKTDIITPGFIPDQDLNNFYKTAKMFVLPSFAEGFGLVAIESLAQGTPVIASNSTSLPEVLGEAGVYFDPNNYQELADKIIELDGDLEKYQKLQQGGLDVIKKYNWQECAEKTLAIYQR